MPFGISEATLLCAASDGLGSGALGLSTIFWICLRFRRNVAPESVCIKTEVGGGQWCRYDGSLVGPDFVVGMVCPEEDTIPYYTGGQRPGGVPLVKIVLVCALGTGIITLH